MSITLSSLEIYVKHFPYVTAILNLTVSDQGFTMLHPLSKIKAGI